MFHALPLIEVKNRSSEKFLESLFQITFIDRNFAAELADCQGFSNMFQKNFTGKIDLFAIRPIGKKFTLKTLHFFFTQHTLEAVEKEHLRLSVYKNILQAVSIIVIQQTFQHQPDPAAK